MRLEVIIIPSDSLPNGDSGNPARPQLAQALEQEDPKILDESQSLSVNFLDPVCSPCQVRMGLCSTFTPIQGLRSMLSTRKSVSFPLSERQTCRASHLVVHTCDIALVYSPLPFSRVIRDHEG